MLIDLKYKNKKIKLNVRICKWKFLGLMFSRREKAKAFLFDFKKPMRVSIHSFFCPRFVAVWFDDENKIVDVKKVKPFKFHVCPKKSFSRLIEIPCNRKYDDIVKSFVGDAKSLNSK